MLDNGELGVSYVVDFFDDTAGSEETGGSGGCNADMWTTVETIEEISHADPSAGWAYMANVVAGGIFVTRVGDAAAKRFGCAPAEVLVQVARAWADAAAEQGTPAARRRCPARVRP